MLYEVITGETNIYLARLYLNIGALYDMKSDYDKALEYYFKSLEMFKQLLGPNHTSVASAYNNIGLVYQTKLV